MVEYSRDDFELPVEDYDFSKVSDVGSLIDQMSRAGGFTASKLARARDILGGAIAKSGRDGVLNWLSFPPASVLQEREVSSLRRLRGEHTT